MTDLTAPVLRQALSTLGAVLATGADEYDLVVIGGASLILRDMIGRATTDVDVLAHLDADRLGLAAPLPPALREAADAVADTLGLPRTWFGDDRTACLLNRAEPLPPGTLGRLEVAAFGPHLRLHLLARADLIALKLDAAVTVGDPYFATKHHQDLVELAPTDIEIKSALPWIGRVIQGDTIQERELGELVAWLRQELLDA